MSVCVCVCVNVWMCVWVYVCVWVNVWMCVWVYVCVWVNVWMCVCILCVCSLLPYGDGLWPKYVDVAWIPLLLQTPVSLSAYSGSSILFVSASFFSQHENIIVLNCLKFHSMCSVVSPGSKFCPARLETVGLRVPNRNLRDFTSFRVEMKRRNRRFSKCSSTINPLNAKFKSHLLSVGTIRSSPYSPRWQDKG